MNPTRRNRYKCPSVVSKYVYSDYFVLNVNPNKYNFTIKCKPVSFNVDGHLKPSFEPNGGQASIDKVSISCQKQMYFEFEPKFNIDVLAVTNLPNGVKFNNGIISGAPSNCGNYKSSIVLKDGTVIGLDIKVSNIQRVL